MRTLVEWRKLARLSQSEFGARVGLQKGFISEIERGLKRPSPETAKRIEEVTGGAVRAADLLGLSRPRGVRETRGAFEHAERRSVSIQVDADVLRLAREYDLDVEGLIAEGGLPAFRSAFDIAFRNKNRDAIDAAKTYVDKYGTPLEQLGFVTREA